MMLKVIIVDDEYLIRQLIRNCIDWDVFGIKIVGEFASAAEALRQMQTLFPDIVLTDICMPDINGLTFAEHVKKICPSIKIIAITGYDNFEYAKKGIHIGLDGYILKPINTKELMETVRRIKDRIISERSRDSEIEDLSAFKKETQEIVREYYLTKLLESDIQEKIISSQYMEVLSIEKSEFLWVGIIEYNVSRTNSALSKEERIQRKTWIADYCKIHLEEAVWIIDHMEHFVILDPCTEIDHRIFIRTLYSEWNKVFGSSLYYGSDTVLEYDKSIHNAYLNAIARLNIALINSDNESEKSLPQHMEKNNFSQLFSITELRKLQYCIETDSSAELQEIIREWFYSWDSVDQDNLELLKVQLLNTLFYLNTLLESQNEEIFQSSYLLFYEKIRDINNLPILRKEFEKICMNLSGKQEGNVSATDTSKLIYSMKQYIRENLDDPDLSLVTLAHAYYLNSSYLSRIFKKEVKCSFIEYLTDQRIEKAKELLRFSNLKSYEVGERVGIYNANYFGILFKKKVGVTPVEYRKQYSE